MQPQPGSSVVTGMVDRRHGAPGGRKDWPHMPTKPQSENGARPRLDGRRVLFDVEADGHVVSCAISLTALQDVSERRHFKPAEVLQCFAKAQPRIEEIVRDKLRRRGAHVAGVLNVWADDFEEPEEDQAAAGPPEATPKPAD
jgi:Protein of unknown function (DUF1488)